MLQKLSKKLLGSKIPVVNIHGLINPEQTEKVVKRLAQIDANRAVALAISVNSPGGLPVQSDIICQKIKDYAEKHHLKVYTFAGDVAASGGYFILSIGDHVVADQTSIIGSIGVVFIKEKLSGVLEATDLELKQYSSNNKMHLNIMNPFQDLEQSDKEYLLKRCASTHEKFINHVKKSRGKKLKIDNVLFSGEVFNGPESLERGLVDQVGSMANILAKIYPDSTLDIQKPKSKWEKLTTYL